MGSSTLLAQAGLRLPRSPDTDINHAFVSQLVLFEFLVDKQWPEGLAELVSDAVGCHHGSRASPITLNDLRGNQRALGRDDWTQLRQELLGRTSESFRTLSAAHEAEPHRTRLYAALGTYELRRLDRIKRGMVSFRSAQ